MDVAFTTSRTLEVFHEVVPYQRLAVFLHPGVLEAMPRLRDRARELGAALQVAVEFVPVRTSAAEALAAMPTGTDAVYLGGLEQLPAAGLDSLIQAFIARRLPSFSTQGAGDVERGVLASYAPRDDLARLARRVSGTIQRILNGEDAGTLPVALTAISQLTLNMATARAIGFSPSWATMTEARLVHEEAPATGPSWSLARVGEEAARTNLDLLEADRVVASGRQSVRLSRSALLPQVQGDATGTLTREETAASSLGQQAQRQGEASVSFSQYVFSDQTWADYTIAQHQQEGRVADRRRTRLDVVLRAATAYLDVLRTRAIARVERENVALTRSNLEVAQLKERAGAGGLSDVYRWQAELAQSRSRVLDADARVQVAALELNSALNRPLEESFHTEDATTDDPALVTSEPRLLDYFGNPATFAVFRDFMVREGIVASPEVQALDAQIAAQRRVGTAARRSFFLPTVTLQGGLSDVFSRGGAGAEPPQFGTLPIERGPDATWQLRLGASLPLFTGFGRTARAAQAEHRPPAARPEAPVRHAGGGAAGPRLAAARRRLVGQHPPGARGRRRVAQESRPGDRRLRPRRGGHHHPARRAAGRALGQRVGGQRGVRLPGGPDAGPARGRRVRLLPLRRGPRGLLPPSGRLLPRGRRRAHAPVRACPMRILVPSALVLPLLAACGKDAPVKAAPLPVTVQQVAEADDGGGSHYSASITPDVQVDAAFKVSGYVDRLLQVRGADGRKRNVQDGDIVRRGTVLARIREREYQDALAEANAALTKSKADFDRTSQLYENRSVSKADYDAAYAKYQADQAHHDQAAQSLADCSLRAPIDGYVLKRAVEIGSLVSPGAAAFSLGDVRAVKVVFGVPDVVIGSMKPGAEQAVSVEAVPDRTFRGQITRVAPSADPSSRVFEVEVTIPNQDGALKSGMIAALEVDHRGAAAPTTGRLVPLNAVVRPPGQAEGYAVYVVEGPTGKQHARLRRVELGDVSGNLIRVTSGLQGGERVIVRGATLAVDSQAVRIIP